MGIAKETAKGVVKRTTKRVVKVKDPGIDKAVGNKWQNLRRDPQTNMMRESTKAELMADRAAATAVEVENRRKMAQSKPIKGESLMGATMRHFKYRPEKK